METDAFLTPDEVAQLTGINKGKRIGGHLLNREQLQIQWLRSSGIPFFENARGRPIIARVAIEGCPPSRDSVAAKSWRPHVILGG